MIASLAAAFAVGAGVTYGVSAASAGSAKSSVSAGSTDSADTADTAESAESAELRPGQRGGAAAPNPASPARTRFPGLVAASGEPTLAGLTSVKPRPGVVVRVAGPFDDRFTLSKLAFNGSRVSGRVLVTSDVSEILDFEAVAGFYGPAGNLLGTNRFVHHGSEESHTQAGPPSQLQTFSIAVPEKLRGQAVSAAVGVPVLVNE